MDAIFNDGNARDHLRSFVDDPVIVEAAASRTGNGQANDRNTNLPAPWPDPLDLVALAETEPEPPAFIIQDWLPAGYAAMLAGHGGVGKSYCALFMAVCIAAGKPWMGNETTRRRVVYLSCEDRANVLHWRLKRICQYFGIDLASLAGWLIVIDLVGHETITFKGGDTPLTTAYVAIEDRVRGDDVLFIDGVSDTFGGNENDRSQVKSFVNSLLALIEANQGAVVLISHVNKPTAQANRASEGYSGSTQWHNAVRARMYLHAELDRDGGQAEKTGNLLLDLQKSNLGTAEKQLKLTWDDGGKLFVPDGGDGQAEHQLDRRQRESLADETFLRMLARLQSQNRRVSHKPNASNYAPTLFGKQPDRDGLTKQDFTAAMERLFTTGQITVESYIGSNRHSYDCIVKAKD